MGGEISILFDTDSAYYGIHFIPLWLKIPMNQFQIYSADPVNMQSFGFRLHDKTCGNSLQLDSNLKLSSTKLNCFLSSYFVLI